MEMTQTLAIVGEVFNGCDIYAVPRWSISCMRGGAGGLCHFENTAYTKAEARRIARLHEFAEHRLEEDSLEF